MSIQATRVNHILEDIVKEGICPSINEAQKELASKLAEMELDKNIAEAREDYKNGRYKTLDDNYINDFTSKMAKRLIPNNS